MSKKSNKKNQGDLIIIIVSVVLYTALFIGAIILCGKYINSYFESKNYSSAKAYVDGEVQKNVIEKKVDSSSSRKTVTKYYTYKYVFEVDGQKYYGEKNNTSEYYGDEFTVLYNPNNPNEFVIEDESGFPILFTVIVIAMAALEIYAIYKVVDEIKYTNKK